MTHLFVRAFITSPVARRAAVRPVWFVGFLLACLSTACSSAPSSPFDVKQRDAYRFLTDANRLVEGNRLADAEIQYGRACSSFALIDDMEGLVTCKTNRAILALQRGRPNAAEALFGEALKISDDFGVKGMRGRIYVYLTLLYIRRKDEESAKRFVARALDILEDKEDRRRALAYRGYLLLEAGELKKAKSDLHDALGTKQRDLESYILINLARLYLEREDSTKAEEYARRAAAIDRDLAQSSHLAYDYAILSEISVAQLDYRQATLYRRRALSLNMALKNNRNARKDARALLGYYRFLKDKDAQREMQRLIRRLR